MKDAEKAYSRKGFKALCYEWVDDYPLLEEYCKIIPGTHGHFKHSSISNTSIDNLAIDLSVQEKNDPIRDMALKMVEKNSITKAVLKNNILRLLYRVGIIGVKRKSYSSVEWSYEDESTLAVSDIKNCQSFEIHKMLWRSLGVFTDARKKIKE